MIFLLSYYFTIIIKHKKFKDNAITAILLLIVVLSYVVWFYFMSNCSDKDSTNIGITLFLGIGLGIFWSICNYGNLFLNYNILMESLQLKYAQYLLNYNF